MEHIGIKAGDKVRAGGQTVKVAEDTFIRGEVLVNQKKQKTYMLKVICPSGCGDNGEVYTVRMTQKWLDKFGAPLCPNCEKHMKAEGAEQSMQDAA